MRERIPSSFNPYICFFNPNLPILLLLGSPTYSVLSPFLPPSPIRLLLHRSSRSHQSQWACSPPALSPPCRPSLRCCQDRRQLLPVPQLRLRGVVLAPPLAHGRLLGLGAWADRGGGVAMDGGGRGGGAATEGGVRVPGGALHGRAAHWERQPQRHGMGAAPPPTSSNSTAHMVRMLGESPIYLLLLLSVVGLQALPQ